MVTQGLSLIGLAEQAALLQQRHNFRDEEIEPVLPHQLDLFIREVVPLLQKRGLFRDAYQGETLRSHFALSRPVVRLG